MTEGAARTDAARTDAARTDRELIDATRPYAEEDRSKSWWLLAQTVLVVVATTAIAALDLAWPLRLLSSIVAGLTTVRLFILYHDFLHGAVLRKSKLAKAILSVHGYMVMTPPTVWRETHNYHHANTAVIVGSNVGSYLTVTTAMWARMSRREQWMYKAIRHPLTIFFGYFTLFMFGMALASFLRSPKKNWSSGLALVLNWAVSATLIVGFGFPVFFFAFFLPIFIATGSGAYLFYAQHNFPEIHIQPRQEWSYVRAALESSSYMKTGPLMAWFTGNIGYHHVHHLNPRIPFYRLPEAMAEVAELRHPRTTTLGLSDVVACFQQKLWDPELGRMVGYPPAAARVETTAPAAS